MDTEDAVMIICALSDGVDPKTGEVFADDSPYQNATIVRALMMAVLALEESHDRARKKSRQPTNAGLPWTIEEDDDLLQRYEAGADIAQLAAKHGRSRSAIQARLEKLGLDTQLAANVATEHTG